MQIIQILGLALTSVVLLVVVRKQRPEMGMLLSLVVGAVILLILLPRVTTVVRLLQSMALNANIHLAYLDTILRIIGIAYLTEFGAQVSRDAGEGTVANKIELAGKVIILVMAVPIISAILTLVLGMVPQ